MNLLIVRHAIACERSARRWPDDGERPLSAAGVVRARKAAAGLKQLAPLPTQVLASPLRRAQQTAAILTRCAGWPEAVTCAELLPGAEPAALLGRLGRHRGGCIAVIGHEPGLGRLLAVCLGTEASESFGLKKMGAALLAFPGSPRAGQAALLWLLPPKLLRAAR